MRRGLVYLLGAAFLTLIICVAWWTSGTELPPTVEPYAVRDGDTAESIAEAFEISADRLAATNGASLDSFRPESGQVILVPPPETSSVDVWTVHGIGVAAEVLGVLMSFWLALVAGLLPAGLRREVLGIGLALGIASYAASQGVAPESPQLTPQFVFGAIKDGFAWSAAFPLFASAFGLTRSGGK